MDWVTVADTAIKIGLGALISAIAALLTLWKTQSFEREKDDRRSHEILRTEKRRIYVEFSAASQALVQSYTMKSCNLDTEEYKKYLYLLNEVQIISPDEIRMTSYSLSSAVAQFILINKNQQEPQLLKNMRSEVDKYLGLFQKLAQLEICSTYKSKPDFKNIYKV